MTPSSILAAALESALDLYLQQDPETRRRCAAMEGKVIALDITGAGIALYFFPGSDGVQVLGHYEGEVDTHLTGSPLGFARLTLGAREDALFQGAVTIQGDTEIGQEFQDILANTDWDWEEQLSHVTGDALAHQAGKLLQETKRFFNDGRNTLEQDISEYLQEEARLLPTRLEAGHFLEEVDELRSRVDRLSARVERLLRAREAQS